MASENQNDKRQDSLPKDDVSIETISESGDSLIRDLGWFCVGRNSAAGSDVDSTEFQKLSIHSKMATFMHDDGRQFIERRGSDDGGLPYSAELYLNDEVWKLNGDDCLLMSHRRYVAKVKVEGGLSLADDLNFAEAARILLQHVKVVKVFQDEQLEECDKAKNVLKIGLDELANRTEGIRPRRDLILLRNVVEKHGSSVNSSCLQDLKNCLNLSRKITTALNNYVTVALKLIQRNESVGCLNDCPLSVKFIHDAIRKAMITHRARLAAVCPSILVDKLGELPDEAVLYVSTDDIHRFADLTTLDQPLLETFLPMIFSKFVTKARELNHKQLLGQHPLSSPMFLFVCKSLFEVAEQLAAHTKNDRVIYYDQELGWQVFNVRKRLQTTNGKHLRRQLLMMAALANHFEPGGPFRTGRFPYKFQLLQDMDAIPEPVRIWLCVLDGCMKDQVHAGSDKMRMVSCFLGSFMSFVASEEFDGETLECLRQITHQTLRTLADSQATCEQERADSDPRTLNCNDMIDRCLDEFMCEHFPDDCEHIKATLRQIFNQVLDRNFREEDLVEFGQTFKQLLRDLSDLPLEWYVKLPPSEHKTLLLRGELVVPVDNLWKNTEHECLKILDPEGFVKMYKLLYGDAVELPEHYQLSAIRTLLDKLATEQSCKGRNRRPKKQKLRMVCDLIETTRDAILYLNRQPDYHCFLLYLKKACERFNPTSVKDQPSEIVDSGLSTASSSRATDPPPSESPNHGEALGPSLDSSESTASSSASSMTSTDKYNTQFNVHLSKTVGLPREKRIERIVADVKSKIRPQLAMTWTAQLKRNELPTVLAGLGAVWSLVVSKAESTSDELQKPSDLQVDCILNLFDVHGQRDDDLNRLLCLSSRQGKDLVLGLTAALLALYENKVLIACHNSSLAERKSSQLMNLFEVFSIQHTISFASLEDVAREGSSETYSKCSTYIYSSIGLKVNKNSSFTQEKSVLLIDDIDLLLQRKILGQSLKRFVAPSIPGLGLVQEKFFCQKGGMTIYNTDSFVKESDDPKIQKLRLFLSRPQPFTLLEVTPSGCRKSSYTNKTLFADHFKRFDKNLCQYPKPENWRLSEDGVLTGSTIDEFKIDDLRYFRFRKTDFQQKVGSQKNYGFLTLGYLPFPYAKVLKEFPRIFAFASAPLDGYEELALHDHYGIHHKVDKWNPLETSPVEFDPDRDFLYVDGTNKWDLNIAVMVAIKAAIARNCSVWVFFKNDQAIDDFRKKFASHLELLSVEAIETASNGLNAINSEMAVDELCVLVIDRKGDLAEDRDIHVIQTFFSEDQAEENLIRRQAERGHGSGSYQLILSRSELPPACNIDGGEVTYEMVKKSRGMRSFGEAMDQLEKNMELYNEIQTFYDQP